MQTEGLAIPHARITGLVVKEMGDETMVYDTDANKAHCLNQTAALVWKYCDGNRSASDIAGLIAEDLGAPVDQKVVWYALGQLNKYNLLSEQAKIPDGFGQMSRRDFMKAVKVAAIIAVPIIISATAPTPAHAASCTIPGGASCLPLEICCTLTGPVVCPGSGICPP
jgi:hypothetical protein